MYYLKDSQGNTVRAIQWENDQLYFIRRHDNNRLELTSDLKSYDLRNIKYTTLDSITQGQFKKESTLSIKHTEPKLYLVQDSDKILENIELPQDDSTKFKFFLERTGITAAVLALIFGAASFIKPHVPVEELQVVQVMDRQQIEKTFIVPVTQTKPRANTPVKTVRQSPKSNRVAKAQTPKSSGALGVLGSLNSSKQKGGLNLDNAAASAGIGRGGLQGSGGVQTSVYAKGMFSAPLGSGGNIKGAGGYGTKGKGGGQAGYGKIQIIGQGGNSYFQPMASEATVDGGLDRNEIAAVIQKHISEVRFCYEQGLQQKPNLSGRVSIKFLIGSGGAVTLAQVAQSSLGQSLVDGCIRDRLKTWNFPKPAGGVTVKVTYPFILRRLSDT